MSIAISALLSRKLICNETDPGKKAEIGSFSFVEPLLRRPPAVSGPHRPT
jgi:hypothetical protein